MYETDTNLFDLMTVIARDVPEMSKEFRLDDVWVNRFNFDGKAWKSAAQMSVILMAFGICS